MPSPDICSEPCTEAATNADCPVCTADDTACAIAACDCGTLCADGTVNNNCQVCNYDSSKCTGIEQETPAACTCETMCTALNDGCEVCSTDITACVGKEPETAAECGCTVACAEGAVNADCEVCTADWSKCGIQADPAPTEAIPAITVNADGISNLSFSPDATPAINQDYTAALTANEGFTLPETIAVTIGADSYTVKLSGENEDGKPDFEGGKLIIPGTLLTGETTITIEAAGVAAAPADDSNSSEDNQPPAEENSPGEDTQPPAEENSPDEDTQPPAEENSPDEDTQPPAEENSPGEDTQPPAEENSPGEDTQPPADEDNPGEENQSPADSDTSSESQQPSEPPVEVIIEDAAPSKEAEEETPAAASTAV